MEIITYPLTVLIDGNELKEALMDGRDAKLSDRINVDAAAKLTRQIPELDDPDLPLYLARMGPAGVDAGPLLTQAAERGCGEAADAKQPPLNLAHPPPVCRVTTGPY